MTSTQRAAVAALLVLGLLGALWSARNRVAVERANKTVALCVDDLEVRQLAALTGGEPAALLAQVKQAGATHVAVSERTLGELLQTSEVRWRNDEMYDGAIGGDGPTMVTLARRLKAAGFANVRPQYVEAGWVTYYLPPVVLTMPKLGVLYAPEAVRAARTAGLQVLARPAPDYLLTPAAIEASLQAAKATGARTVAYNGVSVAGGQQLAKQTAEMLAATDLKFAYVELVPQDGATNLAAALKYEIIRTHSISQEEMVKTSPTRGLDRFTLGVTERGIRLCYVRLLLNPQPDIVAANVAYLASIHDALAKSGFTFGDPQPYQPLSVPRPALALMALGVVGGALWLLVEMLRPRACWFWGLGAVGALGALGGGMVATSLAQAAFPLLAAVVFPTLAVLVASSRARQEPVGRAASPAPAGEPPALRTSTGSPRLGKAIALLLLAIAITALGGFLVAGMLSSLGYMTQIAMFRGVKAAQLLPLVLVLGVTLARTYGSSAAASDAGWPMLRRGFIAAAEAVVKYWHAVAVFLVLGLVAFMVMRSGNDSAVEVSGLELKLRAVLDQILVVRPRTKEILFGFPALLMGLSLLLQGRPRTAWVWLTFGVIGLISLTNTFCHIHTPLAVSLVRVANGIWVGIVVGIVWWVAKSLGERLLRSVWWEQ